MCHGIYTLDSSTRLLTRTLRGEALRSLCLTRNHENFHIWAVQTLQIYVMFKRCPLDGELFGLVISWPLFNPSRTKYVISCVKLFFVEPHVLDDLVSRLRKKSDPCGPDHAKNRLLGRLSPSNFSCIESDCEAPEVIYAASHLFAIVIVFWSFEPTTNPMPGNTSFGSLFTSMIQNNTSHYSS